MNITTQTSHSKIHQLGNLARTYERINYALEFSCNNENERAMYKEQKHWLEMIKDWLLQEPDKVLLPRPPPLRSTTRFTMSLVQETNHVTVQTKVW